MRAQLRHAPEQLEHVEAVGSVSGETTKRRVTDDLLAPCDWSGVDLIARDGWGIDPAPDFPFLGIIVRQQLPLIECEQVVLADHQRP
jgi:hypothetical protein